jgi:protocatechuate 3,4-dioxygenase beta subunit
MKLSSIALLLLALAAAAWLLLREPPHDDARTTLEDSRVETDPVAREPGTTAPRDPAGVPSEAPATRTDVDVGTKRDASPWPRAEGARIEGRVIDRLGQPVAGAKVVCLLASGTLLRHLTPVLEVVTDGEGRYLIAEPPSGGAIEIEAGTDELRGERVALPAVAANATVTVRDIVLEPAITLSGVVRDERGAPIPGARVAVFDEKRGASEVRPEGSDDGAALTDAAGQYRIPGLRRVLYAIRASADGHAATETRRSLLTLTLDPHAKLDLVLPPADREAHGVVVRDDGAPVAGARVIASSESHRVEATADESGRFRLPGLAARSYVLTATAEGLHPGSPVDAAPSDAEIRLQLSRGASVAGRIAAGTGPLGVEIVRGDGPLLPVARARVGENGAFVAEGLPPGRYRVLARTQSAPPHASGFFELAAGERLDVGTIEPAPGGSVRGRVVDGDGRGIGDALVVALPLAIDAANPVILGHLLAGDTRRTITAGDGTFRIDLLAAGDVSLLVRAEKAAQRVVRVAITPGEVVDAGAVAIRGGRAITGRALDVHGVAVSPAAVRCLSSRGVTAGISTTDRDGFFTLPDLEPGHYRLELLDVTLGERKIGSLEVDVTEGDAENVTLRREPAR